MNSATYTIIAGNKLCVNDCPICISKMTPECGIGKEDHNVNWDKFKEATEMALSYGAKNVLITGKGEPILYPGQITQYFIRLYQKNFASREIQTAGNLLAKGGLYDDFLDSWKDLGLNTVAVSIYHYQKEKNRELFHPKSGDHFDLSKLIEKLSGKNINTRLSCVMMKGYIDSVDEVKNLMSFSKENGVFQLTLRTASIPKNSLNDKVSDFIENNRLPEDRLKEITDYISENGSFCYSLPYGASVYQLNNQNVCITSGLSISKDPESLRQLIFFPQGWLTTSWENVQGGRLL